MNQRGAAGKGPRKLLQWAAALTVIVTLVLSGRWFAAAGSEPLYDVILDGERVGTVSSPQAVRAWRDERYEGLDRGAQGREISSNLERLLFVKREAFFEGAEDSKVLAALGQKLQIVVHAVEIRVDGRIAGTVSDMETAFSILEKVKAPYLAQAAAAAPGAGLTAGFEEKVELRKVPQEHQPGGGRVPAADASDTLLAKLVQGEEQPFVYKVVRGDCLSLIAVRHGVTLEEIRRLNPQVKGDAIRMGDELTLSRPRPLLTVRVEAVHSQQVPVPSGVRYVSDAEMKKGEVRVASEGAPGLKRVTYRTVTLNGAAAEVRPLGETEVAAPVPAVVIRGTKTVSGQGSGRFTVPVLEAKVTSVFGRRWGRTHKGTDLISDRREILASDGGTVSFAGWKSGYGHTIMIDHGNGYETLYGHLSRIGVKEGEAVDKGEKIGVMGSSGQSTGVHLHFEIRRHGEQLNPLRYVSVPAA
ncbi:peptidoglycan DD-metalloendopeptidase family protein [Paenibacillus caseinilyticus]|uniref:Lipoprotein nlpD/lppB-like protein n=1 Tax=Paenibacillus mucilaginosus K02 TaxID=997761 RepID=I0BID8_9BACL|nr:M23 family metallopeptidase [Paenibacillus mucilaginosus]AFH62135.1 lipoprotein nlpD/lppB-like protein [Paenibacillus mucilaginosus K02]